MVELLVAILIISILAGLILGVASVAGETAREAQSRNIITRLHALLDGALRHVQNSACQRATTGDQLNQRSRKWLDSSGERRRRRSHDYTPSAS